MRLRIQDVGRLLGLDLPQVGKKGFCPFQKHRRDDKTFRVFYADRSKSGDELYKCWSCVGEDATGDGVKLYAILSRLERAEAYKRLREQGFQLADSAGYSLRERREGVPLEGTRPKAVVPLDLSVVASHEDNSYARELVHLFAQRRKLSPELLVSYRVIGLPRHADGGAIGFVYTDPSSDRPCRVKVRPLETKRMYCIPKGDGEGGKALAPLYLGHLLSPYVASDWLLRVAIVTEGEVDALTLVGCNFPNVVSLPDGAASVTTADLRPLAGFSTWLCAFDRDQAGEEALAKMRIRAKTHGVDVVPLLFDKDDVSYKDANEAWQAGMTREDLARCVDQALEGRYGFRVPWRRVA